MASSFTHTPARTVVTLLAASVLLLSGCGSDDGPEPEAAASPVTSPDAGAAEPTAGAAEPTTAVTDDPPTSPAPDAVSTAEAETDDVTGSATEEAAEEIVITIVDFAYELPDSVPPGSTITVVNEDSAAHTVTSSPPGAFGVSATGGQSVTFTAPEEPGEYKIVCLFHGNMTATLVVG